MKQSTPVEVTGRGGLRGTIDTAASVATDGTVQIILDDGRQLRVPRELLHSATPAHSPSAAHTASRDDRAPAAQVLPVIQEELTVGKRVIESGRVRLRKIVREEQETVDEPLAREEVTVERVPVERFVQGPLPSRREGDAFVIPIVEEVLVVEKRLMLKEELWVRKRTVEERRPETVTLRREEAVIERIPAPGPDATSPAQPPGAAAR